MSDFEQVRSALTEQLERIKVEKKVIAEELQKMHHSSGQNILYASLVVSTAVEDQSNRHLLAQLEAAVARYAPKHTNIYRAGRIAYTGMHIFICTQKCFFISDAA